MVHINSIKSVLVVGREVGPIICLIRKLNPKIIIGSIDLLGNQETRTCANWNFSVEKQSPDMSILRPKHRNFIDLIYELTLVMLEEHNFDVLIPTSPLNTNIEYIMELLKEIRIPIVNIESLKKTQNPYVFLTEVIDTFPEFNLTNFRIDNIPDYASEGHPNIIISKSGVEYFSSEIPYNTKHDNNGFFIPFLNINCCFLVSFADIIDFIGIQTLAPPHEHFWFLDHFEKNAYTPFFSPAAHLEENIRSFMINLVQGLQLEGMITIFFVLIKNQIIPIFCNVVPDENFDLWENRARKSLISTLLMTTDTGKYYSSNFEYAFKVPIYFNKTIKVPLIPSNIASQRNLVGVLSHPIYPICRILELGNTYQKVKHNFQRKRDYILEILRSTG